MNFTDAEIERQRIANERHDLERERDELGDVETLQARVAELESLFSTGAQPVAFNNERAEKAETRAKELEAALRAAFERLTDPHERAPKAAVAEVISDALGVPIADLTLDSVGGATLEAHPGDREGTRGQEPAEAPQAATEAHDARATGDAPGPGTGVTLPRPSEAKPVCSVCNDTHVMPATGWMCTHCPLPCRTCGNGGPFCTYTPCACGCHPQNATGLLGLQGIKQVAAEHCAAKAQRTNEASHWEAAAGVCDRCHCTCACCVDRVRGRLVHKDL